MIKHIFVFFLFVVGMTPAVVLASSGTEAHKFDEHTLVTMMYQAINVSILLGGLFYFLRKPIREHFLNKRKEFVANAEKAAEMESSARSEREAIQRRIVRLEESTQESLSRAHAEAADLKRSILLEAEQISKKLRDEAASVAALEVSRARMILRDQLVQDSVELAEQNMESLSIQDQHRLQGEFVENLQVVKS